MRIDIKSYLEDNGLTIYVIAKKSGYGYTTLHKSFNKKQSSATSINLRDIEAIAKRRIQQCGKFCVNWNCIT
ncbi:hypothetical protein NBRC111452_2340 [Companilactobacillus farciminis]|nr:hypothetical protein NBRC111452_2340 [Companilactobacillus farciminis]